MSREATVLEQLSAEGLQHLSRAFEASKDLLAAVADPPAAAFPAVYGPSTTAAAAAGGGGAGTGQQQAAGAAATAVAVAQGQYVDALQQTRRVLEAVRQQAATGAAAQSSGDGAQVQQLQEQVAELRRQLQQRDVVLDSMQRSISGLHKALQVWDEKVDT